MQGQQVSHYRLTEKLGAGTYGEVWKGVHVDDPDFTVAVKLVSPQVREDPAFLTALRKECRALDRMDHPSIVRFRELVVRDGTVAMVLELLEGADLEAVLASGPQPVEEVVRILDKVLDGLAYAHGKGVVHRDIKPGNIYRCSDGRVKLMDFGIARAADGTKATQTGTLKGTLDYMAPERFSQGGGGPASDVYAVGLVAWELLSGRRACTGTDLAQKIGWHMTTGLPDVRTERADCPVWLAEVVAALGSKEASGRPVDGAAALALLRSRQSAVASVSGARPAPVALGTVELSTAEVAATLSGPQPPSTGPGTVVLESGASQPPNTPPTGPTTAPQTVAVPAGALPPVVSEDVDLPEPSGRSSGGGKVLAAVAAVLVLGVGGWLLKGELDRRAALEAAYQSAASADSIADWKAFLAEYPAHPRQGEAEAALSEALEAEQARTGISKWVSIPGGSFQMGSESGEKDEQPVHTVTVEGFELMQSEVTVGQYRKCVDAGECTEPDAGGYKGACNWDKSGREDHPINCVDWTQATTFAKWAGGRLPTEAEWEYAARSGGKSQTYPWGNEEATCSRAVMDDGGEGCGKDRTWPVCSKPAGNSRHGLCDLAGNVWEWVQDGYHDTYSGAPEDGTAWEGEASYRVSRGGGWFRTASILRASRRGGFGPSRRNSNLGIRLAR